VRAPKREKKSRSENSGTRIWIKSEDTPGCHEFLFTSDKSVLLVIIGTEELASGILGVSGSSFWKEFLPVSTFWDLISRMHQNSVNT
jgi:hypothetical protein